MMKRLRIILFVSLIGISVAPAQQTPPTPTPTPTAQSDATSNDAEDNAAAIKPKRPTASRPAETQGAGLLQIEYGYDGNFRSRDLRRDETGALTISFAATDRLQLELNLDTVASQVDRATNSRTTGVGDARLGFQFTTLEDTARHPSLAFAYFIKLPSASATSRLGTNRVDHQFIALTSKKVRDTDFDFNLALLLNGRQGQSGYQTGGQLALGFSRDLARGFGVQGELSGQTLDADQPRGAFALGALTYKINSRLQFDAGSRFGLNPTAPRFGVFAGVTVGVTNLYRRRN